MKENFIQSTIILMVGGLITKLLAMIIKINMARTIGTQGLGLYMLLLPTFMLFITISQFGFPLALSKLISEDTKNNKKLFFSVLPIAIVINFLIMIIIILFAPVIANYLLKNKDTTLGIYAMTLVLPFTTISSICRSYFFGKSYMLPHVLSNIVEEVIRYFIIIFFIPYFILYDISYTVCFLILTNVFSELFSTLVLIFFLPKNVTIKKNDLIPNKTYIKESLDICIPNTTSRFIGSIGYFLEPIILTHVLLKVGYSNYFITNQYGILSGYVIPLLLLPSFFTLAISQALLPAISKEFARGNSKRVKRKIKEACFLSLLIGFPITILLMLKPSFFLQLIYHTNEGYQYLEILAPICLIQYLQAPFSNALEAMGKSKEVMIVTILTTIVRSILTLLLSYFRIGMWGLIISISINIILTTFFEYKIIKKSL